MLRTALIDSLISWNAKNVARDNDAQPDETRNIPTEPFNVAAPDHGRAKPMRIAQMDAEYKEIEQITSELFTESEAGQRGENIVIYCVYDFALQLTHRRQIICIFIMYLQSVLSIRNTLLGELFSLSEQKAYDGPLSHTFSCISGFCRTNTLRLVELDEPID